MTNSSRKNNKWSFEEENLLKENYNLPTQELLKLFPNRTYLSLYQKWNGLGLKKTLKEKRHNEWPEEDRKFLIENYGKIPTYDLMEKFGKSKHTIEEYARRQGIKMIKDENGKTANTKNNPTLAPLLGEAPQVYYWMGYLLADGYMHQGLGQIVLCSAIADKEHLEEYAKFLNAEAKVYKSSPGFVGEEYVVDHVRISVAENINAKKIAEKFDWKNNKTYNPPSVEILNKVLNTKEKFLSYLIGFAGGDGYISPTCTLKLENHSSYITFFDFLLKRSKEYGLETETIPTINPRGYVQFSFNGSFVKKLKQFIIENDLIVLKRKWQKVDLNLLNPMEKSAKMVEDIKKLIQDGKTRQEIMNILNISDRYLSGICDRNGISHKSMGFDIRKQSQIFQIENGIILKEWKSISEASRHTGILISSICNCAKGITKSAGKFQWKYKKDLTSPKDNI